eukprot:SAG22_NODE_6752_length_816_cov_0.916318_1_plen_75_part_10
MAQPPPPSAAAARRLESLSEHIMPAPPPAGPGTAAAGTAASAESGAGSPLKLLDDEQMKNFISKGYVILKVDDIG